MYNKYLAAIFLILYGCGGGGSSPPKPPDPVIECDAIVIWGTPTERTDGTELLLEDIAKFTIYVNSEPSVEEISLERVVDIENMPATTQWEIPELSQGEHWFYMTVTDDEDRQSTFSNIKSKICP